MLLRLWHLVLNLLAPLNKCKVVAIPTAQPKPLPRMASLAVQGGQAEAHTLLLLVIDAPAFKACPGLQS